MTESLLSGTFVARSLLRERESKSMRTGGPLAVAPRTLPPRALPPRALPPRAPPPRLLLPRAPLPLTLLPLMLFARMMMLLSLSMVSSLPRAPFFLPKSTGLVNK